VIKNNSSFIFNTEKENIYTLFKKGIKQSQTIKLFI